jgi:maleylacetoacetate isomerase
MHNLTLYNYFRSSTSFRVRLALEIKKLNYDYKPVHLLNNGGEQNTAEYRALNPMGGVPTLVHDVVSGEKRVIAQSMAIIQYLDDAFPHTYQLFPKDAFKKSLVHQFCENINADMHSYSNLKTLQYLEKNFSATEDHKNKWIHHWMQSGFSACEKMLEKHAGVFCFGDQVSAADILLIPHLVTAQRYKFPIEQFKKMNLILNHCMSIDSFKRAHPFRQIDTPEELRLKD